MPHVHDFYLIVWFEKGMGKHMIDFKEYDVQDGTLFLYLWGKFINLKKCSVTKDMVLYSQRTFYTI